MALLERIWLVGAGNMGGAMLRRWAGAGIDPAAITVIDPGSPAVPEGVRHVSTPPVGECPTALVLAVKPQQLHAVAPVLAPVVAGVPLLVSILAGVEVATLAKALGANTVVRAMPNLPVAIGKGVVGLTTPSDDADARAAAETLMQPLGLVEWVPSETMLDALTALAGCGPGFVFRFVDALAEAGTALGLPADQAQRLALATVEGAGLMAAAADESPAVLADRVASPGGSTREGLNVLDRDDALKTLLRATLAASARRNAEMAAEARK
ncbi:pyrroline-5-carboxylate reductase [Sphingomonas pituitosa]|uniref:pyrroline-5-carboxylate reductase n=1 Tax=Sphingomonas pituitosa TaxID=99597 RepID=UPI00082F702A|nr:pyrroline-5-carboxylate reductase [Sphingomonas pituitosa]